MKLGFGSFSLFLIYANTMHIVYEGAFRPDSADPSDTARLIKLKI